MQASKSRRRRAFAALGGVLLLATMVTGAQAQTYTYKDLYKFKGSPTDGSQPIAGVDPRFGRQSIWHYPPRRQRKLYQRPRFRVRNSI